MQEGPGEKGRWALQEQRPGGGPRARRSVGLASPMSFLCPGPLLPLYPTPTMGSPFPLLGLPPPLYPMMCSLEHPLSADIAVATRADEDGDT